MFVGLIRYLGEIVYISRSDSHIWELKIKSIIFEHSKIGDSIAVNGCCLTIVKLEGFIATFTIMIETLRKTTFTNKVMSEYVHVEKSASNHDLIEGHPITGHISGVVILIDKVYMPDNSLILTFKLLNCSSYLTYKGCVAIDGVSLTVANLTDNSFTVSLIPHTQEVTLLTRGDVGSTYNIEFPTGTNISLPDHLDIMSIAIKNSLLGRITAPSNPWVGCVITDCYGNIVTCGHHQKRGQPHAEVNALNKLKNCDIKNYVLYCTLEPCNHTGLQPPCTKAIIESGIMKVVVGILDPDERVAGTGVKCLLDAGINVTVMDDQRVTKSLRTYIKHRRTRRPYVIAKMAMSMDGKIAPNNKSCQFSISCQKSRDDTHVLRLKSQAILIGTRTAQLDQPRLNVRLSSTSKYSSLNYDHRPLRCFIDFHGKVITGPLLDIEIGPTLVFTNSESCCEETINIWKKSGIEIFYISNKNCLDDIMDELGRRGILTLLVEGGGELFTSFVENDLVDQIRLYIAPKLLGCNGISLFNGDILMDRYCQVKLKKVGDDSLMVYERK